MSSAVGIRNNVKRQRHRMVFLLLLMTGGTYHAPSFSRHQTAAFQVPLTSFHTSQSRTVCHHLALQSKSKILSSSMGSTDCTGDANSNHDDAADYFTQQVTNKARALDVEVFRGLSATAQEFVSEQQKVGNVISKDEAVDLIMEHYDEDGNYIYMYNNPQYESETYFVAVYNGASSDGKEEADKLRDAFARQHGIIGAVSAQLRRRSPLIAGPSTNDADSSNTALPSVPIPSPHVYVANMKADEIMQRKGVGTALLSSVLEYAKSWSEKMNVKIPLVLSVDNDNTRGKRLYEKFGFEYLEENNTFCMMVLWP